MLIQDMDRQMSLDFVKETRIGRIACAHGAQPYVTPFSYAFDEGLIYSFATMGKKVEWMRANPLVCIEVEKIISRHKWQTVVIFGRFQELQQSKELPDLRKFAHDLLARVSMWWEPGAVKTIHCGIERKIEAVYFRVSVDEITGHQAFPNKPSRKATLCPRRIAKSELVNPGTPAESHFRVVTCRAPSRCGGPGVYSAL